MEDKISLYTYHSYASCIGEGFRFLAKHLLLAVKVLMPYYCIVAILSVLSYSVNMALNVSEIAGEMVSVSGMLVAVVIYILAYVAGVLANGRLFLMFRRLVGVESMHTTLARTLQLAWRSAPYTIWGLVIYFLHTLISALYNFDIEQLSPAYLITAAIIFLVLGIIAVVFAAPLAYSYYCRMMEPSMIDVSTEEGREMKKAFSFNNAYKKGFNHKGKILGVLVLSAFLFFVFSVIILLPCVVSAQTYLSSMESRLNFGDTVIIPMTGYILMFLASVLSVTFVNMLSVAMYASMLYLHGDIYSSEK